MSCVIFRDLNCKSRAHERPPIIIEYYSTGNHARDIINNTVTKLTVITKFYSLISIVNVFFQYELLFTEILTYHEYIFLDIWLIFRLNKITLGVKTKPDVFA